MLIFKVIKQKRQAKNITFHMKNTKKKLKGNTKVIKSTFTGTKLTKYSGLNIVSKYFRKQGIGKEINDLFPTTWYNSTKFGMNQILLSVIFASLAGINRLKRIANFTNDSLLHVILKLDKGINENAISTLLKKLGQSGARQLQAYLLNRNSNWLAKSGLTKITLDADSTVSMVYGKQEGAEKGFNSKKKGAKSYHPLLVFISEIKLLYHTWFRTGSAYTSNGIIEFMKEVHCSLPKSITEVFFRADSGFFNGPLFDLFESFSWDYLVKVKLKNLKMLLRNQTWIIVDKSNGIEICEFEYKANGWSKSRKLKGIRTITGYEEVDFFGQKQKVAIYDYACYISSYDKNAVELHKLYTERSTSETWIEQVKGQLMAGKTLTDDFWANDILWQLNVFSYNISIMMRYRNKFHRQEHRTFKEWFIDVPGKIVSGGHAIEIKMYKQYYQKDDWIEFEQWVNAA